MKRPTRAALQAMQRDLSPMAAQVNELAGKYGVAPSTVAKHVLLLAVHAPGVPEWNRRLAEHGRKA